MSERIHTKFLIIGAGPAGYTAAIYAARANLDPILVQGLQPGGQLTITTDVENYPGFADVIQGPWLMEQMQKQAEHVGTTLISDIIVTCRSVAAALRLHRRFGRRLYRRHASPSAPARRRAGSACPSEEQFRGSGVSACATCDGFFFRGKEVAVVGGGNTAVEEALYLTNHASSVTLIHRRDTLRAEKILQDAAVRQSQDHGDLGQRRRGIPRRRQARRTSPACASATSRPARTSELDCDGVFVAIGHDPVTELFKGQLTLDDEGYIVTKPDSTATEIPGVFAAGDVKDKIFRQAVTAAGMGCMAALEAEKFLAAPMAPLARRGRIVRWLQR